MAQYIIKLLVSASLIVIISEISKRSTLLGSIFASLPLVSILAMFWLYRDTGDLSKVAELATGILWLVLPSLLLFIVFPVMISRGFGFYVSLISGCVVTAFGYWCTIWLLSRSSG